MSKRTLTTPEELRDFCIGKDIFRRGGYLNDCTSEAMRQGFSRMANHQVDVMVGTWQTFAESPRQTVKFSEAAFKEVAYSNEYHRQGVDYIEPSL
jgi:hypothetical protein